MPSGSTSGRDYERGDHEFPKLGRDAPQDNSGLQMGQHCRIRCVAHQYAVLQRIQALAAVSE